ncbi:hypothetical protein JAAARDRAFT_693656 [Jaapia argillacea MUCL 33604]|uniref:F-box domain-containing protein n=1 Tax=Jaapia argillacea MUCL 33604 TaxID=933084 RepID=A0A067PXC9_9AGAM|nr:hypothetical protein JAAARDRAFT_693656 [Jaapia argillacea MUCL 33604]
MSLLQDLLVDSLEKRKFASPQRRNHTQFSPDSINDSDDDLVNVVSVPGTPSVLSRPSSRPPSPSGGSSRLRLGTSRASHRVSSDPLRAFPTDISQLIFNRLSITDLAKCSRVSQKWNKSQTLNYVWFQHYRKENFHDESLPPGKWTKRESKQNWRMTYMQTIPHRSPPSGSHSRGSGYSTPSGYQTPKEVREERWRTEEETSSRPSKQEMRGMYKELGGRKAKTKNKLGSTGRGRDKGGLGSDDMDGY